DRKVLAVWGRQQRQQIESAFLATRTPYAADAFRGVADALDGFAHKWAGLHTEVCEATSVRHEQSEELLDLRMQCLSERLEDARAQIDLFGHPDAKVVERGVQAAQSLERLERCSDFGLLQKPMRPPTAPTLRGRVDGVRTQLARARAFMEA